MVDILSLIKDGENVNVECKLASNGLPKSIWETYSAFANTNGGVNLLGIKESDKRFDIEGVEHPQKLVAEIWACLHNSNKISTCVLFERHVYVTVVEGKSVIVLEIPRADRHEQPVFIGSDMFRGTYVRNGDGDFRCSRDTVLAMLRDNTDESQDSKMVKEMDIHCLNEDCVKRYRTMFSHIKPNHVWEALPDDEFLLKIGAAGKDHQNRIRPTRAGILAFGDFLSITSVYPNYYLDYQEKQGSETRWTDRVCASDSTWSGNVLDFYFRIIERLLSSIRTPFRLNGIFRESGTPIHTSIREVLANCLVHADYNGRFGIVIHKTPEMISFSNPGLFRMDVRAAISGGLSDTRNRNLFHIFNLIQLVEHAGSGLCTLFYDWKRASLPSPTIDENIELRRTTVSLQFIIQNQAVYQNTNVDVLGAQKTDQSAQKTIDTISTQICALMRNNSSITVLAIASQLGLSRFAIARKIKYLKECGVIERVGPDKGGFWRVLTE